MVERLPRRYFRRPLTVCACAVLLFLVVPLLAWRVRAPDNFGQDALTVYGDDLLLARFPIVKDGEPANRKCIVRHKEKSFPLSEMLLVDVKAVYLSPIVLVCTSNNSDVLIAYVWDSRKVHVASWRELSTGQQLIVVINGVLHYCGWLSLFAGVWMVLRIAYRRHTSQYQNRSQVDVP